MVKNIRINDLFYIYENGGEQIVALRGLTLEIAAGECLAIRGPNGSGKSTLVKILTGYQTQTAGEIFIDDLNFRQIDPIRLRREFVASIDQNGSLIKELSVQENLALAYSLSGTAQIDPRASATQILESHQLAHLAARYPEELSSGERQYLSILAAVATDPKVLVADEPSAELDDNGAAAIYSLIRSLSESRIVILVTHDIRAERFATRTVRIREGRIGEQWSAGEPEISVVDQFGWMRVREIAPLSPARGTYEINSESEAILKVTNLDLSYADHSVFSRIGFEARAGELIAFDSTRPAKSGKSSLLRILAGLQDPTGGEVEIAGKRMNELDREARAKLRSRSLSYLPQRSRALERVTLAEYLGTLEIDLGSSLNNRRDTHLGNFSGGERARIELLKIIGQGRSILLLDEPTSQIDESRTFEVVESLFGYLSAGGLVVVSTRNQNLLAAADQILDLG